MSAKLSIYALVRICDLVFVERPQCSSDRPQTAIILPRYTFTAPSRLRARNFPLVISIHRE